MQTNKPMTPTKLPLQLDLVLNNTKDMNQTKLYSKRYRSKIGLKGEWYLSRKEKGTRAIWTGKFFVDKTLMPIDNIPTSFTKLFPVGVCLDGVLQGISYDFRYPTNWDNVTYVVFDYPKHSIPFRHRLDFLKKQPIFRDEKSYVRLTKYTQIEHIQNRFNIVNEEFAKAVEDGQPGVMLIEADSNYEGKRVPHLIEYTERNKGTGRIVSFHEGSRNTHKILGKFKCISTKGKYFFVSKEIPDEIRKMYQFVRTKCVFVDPNAPQVGDTLHFESDKMIDTEIPVDPLFVKVTAPVAPPQPPSHPKGRGELRARRRGRKMALKRNPKSQA